MPTFRHFHMSPSQTRKPSKTLLFLVREPFPTIFRTRHRLPRQGELPDKSFHRSQELHLPNASKWSQNGTIMDLPDRPPKPLTSHLQGQGSQAPGKSACRTGQDPEQVGLPVAHPDMPASWTCQPPGPVSIHGMSASLMVSLQDRSPQRVFSYPNQLLLDTSASGTGWPPQQDSLQVRTQDQTPMTNC